jgi:hypothetical protein
MKYAKHFLKPDDKGMMNQSMRTHNGKSIYDKKFRNIHKLFYSRSEHGIRYTVDAVPDNYQPLNLYEIDNHSEIFESDEASSSSSCERAERDEIDNYHSHEESDESSERIKKPSTHKKTKKDDVKSLMMIETNFGDG